MLTYLILTTRQILTEAVILGALTGYVKTAAGKKQRRMVWLLAAAGVVSERFRDKNVQMHRFNVKNNTVTDVDADGATLLSCQAPRLSVEENVRIYGGDVRYGNLQRLPNPTAEAAAARTNPSFPEKWPRPSVSDIEYRMLARYKLVSCTFGYSVRHRSKPIYILLGYARV